MGSFYETRWDFWKSNNFFFFSQICSEFEGCHVGTSSKLNPKLSHWKRIAWKIPPKKFVDCLWMCKCGWPTDVMLTPYSNKKKRMKIYDSKNPLITSDDTLFFHHSPFVLPCVIFNHSQFDCVNVWICARIQWIFYCGKILNIWKS